MPSWQVIRPIRAVCHQRAVYPGSNPAMTLYICATPDQQFRASIFMETDELYSLFVQEKQVLQQLRVGKQLSINKSTEYKAVLQGLTSSAPCKLRFRLKLSLISNLTFALSHSHFLLDFQVNSTYLCKKFIPSLISRRMFPL